MSEIPQGSNVSIFSKNEKKAKEQILKLGLKPVPGISRVTFKKKDNQIFAIDRPEVYKSQGGNYVVFGEAKIDDFPQRLAKAQEAAQAEGVLPAGQDAVSKDPQSIQADMQAAADNAGKEAPADDDDEEVDESDLKADDIEIVMQQANVTRAKAAKALKAHNGDIVNTIMSLSD